MSNFFSGYKDLEFQIYWRGRKDKNPQMVWYHEPGIMDGGAVLSSSYKVLDNNHALVEVYYGYDGFACETWTQQINFEIEKCKEYTVKLENDKLTVDTEYEFLDLDKERREYIERLRKQSEERKKLIDTSDFFVEITFNGRLDIKTFTLHKCPLIYKDKEIGTSAILDIWDNKAKIGIKLKDKSLFEITDRAIYCDYKGEIDEKKGEVLSIENISLIEKDE